MKNHPSIPLSLLKSLQEHIDILKIDVPLEVRRQIWVKDENAFKKALIPHIRSYINQFISGWSRIRRQIIKPIDDDKVVDPDLILNTMDIEGHNKNELLDIYHSSNTNPMIEIEEPQINQSSYSFGLKRKSNEYLKTIIDYIGNDLYLYNITLKYIKEIIALGSSKGITVERAIKNLNFPMSIIEDESEGTSRITFMSGVIQALSSLRFDLIMSQHDRNQNEICENDDIYKFAWCLDACINDNNFDERRLKEMKITIKSIEKRSKKRKAPTLRSSSSSTSSTRTRMQTRKSRKLNEEDDEEDEDYQYDSDNESKKQTKHRPSAFRLKSGNTVLVESRADSLDNQSKESIIIGDISLVLRRSNSLLGILHNIFNRIMNHSKSNTNPNTDKDLTWLSGFLHIALEIQSIISNGDRWLSDNELNPPRPRKNDQLFNDFIREMVKIVKLTEENDEYQEQIEKIFEENKNIFDMIGEQGLFTYIMLFFTLTRVATADEDSLIPLLKMLKNQVGVKLECYPEFIQDLLFTLATAEYEEVQNLRPLIINEVLLPLAGQSDYIHLQLLNYLILAVDSDHISFKDFNYYLTSLVEMNKRNENKEIIKTYKEIYEYYEVYFKNHSIDTSYLDPILSK